MTLLRFAHVSEFMQVTDEEGADWKESVKEGQAVKAVIMDVNLETKKVSLGLKRSLFPEDYEGSSDEEELSDEDEEEEDDAEDDEDEEMDGEGEVDSDEGDEIDLAALLKAQGGDDSDSDAEMEDEEPAVSICLPSCSVWHVLTRNLSRCAFRSPLLRPANFQLRKPLL